MRAKAPAVLTMMIMLHRMLKTYESMTQALTVFVIILAEVEPDIVGIGKNRIIVF